MFESIKLIEYDIKSANANVMYVEGIIDKEKYDSLTSMNKMKRVITVGNMIKGDMDLYKDLKAGIKKYTDKFIEVNNLSDNVYEVVTDAVWVYNKYPSKTKLNEHIEFTKDRVATSVMVLNDKIKIYYNSTTGELYNRGIGKIDHGVFTFMKRLKKFMKLKEGNHHKLLYKTLHEYHLDYIRGDVEESDRFSIAKKNKDLQDDPGNDDNYKFVKLMIKNLL